MNNQNKQYTITLTEAMHYLNEDLHYINNGKNYYYTSSMFYIDSIKIKTLCIEKKLDCRNVNDRYWFNYNDLKRLKDKINEIKTNINVENWKIRCYNNKIFKKKCAIYSINILIICAILMFLFLFNNNVDNNTMNIITNDGILKINKYNIYNYPSLVFVPSMSAIIVLIFCSISKRIFNLYYKNYVQLDKNIVNYIEY